jgi:hypothetical protein
MKTRTHKTINQYSYPQLARFKPAKAPGQFSFGTGGQFSIGANMMEHSSTGLARGSGIGICLKRKA